MDLGAKALGLVSGTVMIGITVAVWVGIAVYVWRQPKD